jgi:uncharacterized surface protein with fasciclin (FAS1) repeats
MSGFKAMGLGVMAAMGAALALPAGAAAQYSNANGGENAMTEKTIVDVAVEAGSFETLVTAVKAAGLVETLSSEGPFTVFAPTDEAFAKLPEGTLESLLADKEALAAVLTYHVLPGRVTAKDVMAAGQVRPATVQGESLNVRVKDGKVLVDDATVVQANVQASNGVIHVIDTVVLPESMKASAH